MTDKDSQTLLSRRKLLALLGVSGAAVLGAGSVPKTTSPVDDDPAGTVDEDDWMPPAISTPPPGTESILDHGGIVGVDTPAAAERNVRAIHAASVAAETNTVYLPAGRWYVGDRESSRFLYPGNDAAERGAAGLGFVGDGPDETFLVFQKDTLLQGGGNEISYAAGIDHGEVVWRNLTYDGNYHEMQFDSDTRQWGIDVEEDSTANFRVENFRLQNIHGVGIGASGSSAFSLLVDRCSFRDIGIGRVNQSNGTSLSHILGPTVPAGETMVVTNSRFELTSGNVIDFSRSDNFGNAIIHNCYASGIGDTFIKEKGMKEVRISKLRFQANTPELEAAMSDEAIAQGRHGRGFLKQLSGPGNGTTYILEDIEASDMLRRAVNIRSGKHWIIRGGREGPIRFRNINMDGDEESPVWQDYAPDSYFEFDVGTMIAENVGGVVFECEYSRGTIETVYERNTLGIGGTGDVFIGSVFPRTDTETIAPMVPSRIEVGIDTYHLASDQLDLDQQ